MRRTATLAGLVLVGGLLGPSAALAEDDHRKGKNQLRWVAVEDSFTAVLPDGETFTDDDPPPDEAETPPVGTRIFIGEVLYEADRDGDRGDEVGRTYIECTAHIADNNFLCDIAFVLDEGSQLHGSVHIDFTDLPEGESATFDIAATGGTGDFARAVGEVSLTDLTDQEDPEAETVSLYETELKFVRK